MSDNFNFNEIGKDAVNNEPPRTSQETVSETVKNGSVTVYNPDGEGEQEDVKFEFKADFVASSLVEGFAALWRSAWGKSEGAELTDKEREGFNSLLERGAQHFGFIRYISGAKGFFVELLGRIISAIVPRAAKTESRNHFKETVFNGSETVKKTDNNKENKEDESVSTSANKDSGNGLAASTFSSFGQN